MGEAATVKAPRRLSPAEAVDLLCAAGMSDMAAAAALTDGAHDGSCPLWCDGRQVPSHFVITLAVEIDDRTGDVGITSLTREAWVKPRAAYDWRFDARRVQDLLSRQKTHARPGSRRSAPPLVVTPYTPIAPPSKKVSKADLRNCLEAIKKDHEEKHPGEPPLDADALHKAMEDRLGVTIPRDDVRNIRDKHAPGFKRPVGRPRKA
jgi:hypothetical protein